VHAAPLFHTPVHKASRADTLTHTLACAASVTLHRSLSNLAEAEAGIIMRCMVECPQTPVYERYELMSRLHAESGVGNNYFQLQQRSSARNPNVRATGGGRRAAPQARYHTYEAGETLERHHEAWMTLYPIPSVVALRTRRSPD
jgi:hypothetical protein